jgi:hypothetical protein
MQNRTCTAWCCCIHRSFQLSKHGTQLDNTNAIGLGNCMVIKPSEKVPLSVGKLAELLRMAGYLMVYLMLFMVTVKLLKLFVITRVLKRFHLLAPLKLPRSFTNVQHKNSKEH